MKYNGKQISRLVEWELRRLGVFKQLNGSYAFSETALTEHNMNDLSLFKCDTLQEGINSLKNNLDDMIMEYCRVWSLLESHILSVRKNNIDNNISVRVISSVINNLILISSDYKDLSDVNNSLKELREIKSYISDSEASLLSYFSTIIYIFDDELRTEYERILDIKELLDNNKIASNKKRTVTSSLFGLDDGMGGRGRSTMWSTPYGGYDYANDRVMDGREVGEGKGWATEKFKTTNKFKRHPELNPYKKYFKYKIQPDIYKKKKRLKDRLKSKDRNNPKKTMLLGDGKVYVTKKNDPAYTYWVDQQRNKAYSWEDRIDNSAYPTWDQYKR